jgi:hypothetical protein
MRKTVQKNHAISPACQAAKVQQKTRDDFS